MGTDDQLMDARERLAVVEAVVRSEAALSAERHETLMVALSGLRERHRSLESRVWKIAIIVAGSGAGASALIGAVF